MSLIQQPERCRPTPASTTPQILIVDDEPESRSLLMHYLEHLGFRVDACGDAAAALTRLEEADYHLIFTDLQMPGISGIALLEALRRRGDATPLVLITGYPTLTLAVEAMRKGAADFITKPVELKHLEVVISRILEEAALRAENLALNLQLREQETVAALNTALEAKVEELSVLYEIGELTESAKNMDALFDKIVEMASLITGSREISIFLWDRETNRLVPKRTHGIDGTLDPIPFGHGPLGLATLEKRTLLIEPQGAAAGRIPHHSPGAFVGLPMMIKGEVFGVLNVSRLTAERPFSEKELQLLEALVAKAALALENQALYESLYDNLVDTLRSLVMAVEAKDPYTRNHSQRVTDLAILIARTMGRPRSELETLRFGGIIHDIGKIGIQDTVLLKPDRLNAAEGAVIRTHPEIGENIVKPLRFLREEQAIVRHHHERFDGTGYPDGLRQDRIPFLARVLAVADTYDAITSTRPYRRARQHAFAVQEITRCRYTQFDPEVADAFLASLPHWCNPAQVDGIDWNGVAAEVRNTLTSL